MGVSGLSVEVREVPEMKDAPLENRAVLEARLGASWGRLRCGGSWTWIWTVWACLGRFERVLLKPMTAARLKRDLGVLGENEDGVVDGDLDDGEVVVWDMPVVVVVVVEERGHQAMDGDIAVAVVIETDV